jgi:hypothetical protein
MSDAQSVPYRDEVTRMSTREEIMHLEERLRQAELGPRPHVLRGASRRGCGSGWDATEDASRRGAPSRIRQGTDIYEGRHEIRHVRGARTSCRADVRRALRGVAVHQVHAGLAQARWTMADHRGFDAHVGSHHPTSGLASRRPRFLPRSRSRPTHGRCRAGDPRNRSHPPYSGQASRPTSDLE